MRRLVALACAVAVAGPLLAGPVSRVPAAATSVSCPAAVTPLDPAAADPAWTAAAARLRSLSGPSTFPFGATGSDRYVRTGAHAWTSGFYPASSWLMYQRTQDLTWRARARSYTDRLLPVARWRGTHDLGFMIGLPVGLARQLDPDRAPRYDAALRRAARSLSSRWNPQVGAFQAGTYAGRWGLIIDSAMNAPLLIEQGQAIGGAEGARLVTRGVRHLLTLSRDFVRADGSTAHRQAYDPRTGRLVGPVYGQGLSASSTWARGQAWAIAGFARGYALTQDARLLDAARRVSDYWTAHVPDGCVPAWDLDVTRDSAPRDASAAAIAAYGLLTLASVEPDPARAFAARDSALRTLGTLVRNPWLPAAGAAGVRGVLQGQTYNVPADRREGTYVWGDTYLLAALALAAKDTPLRAARPV
jgi:unsaturated chondroitin disaccharide hydrolase